MSDDIFLIDTAVAKREVETLEKSIDTITRSLENFDKHTSFSRIEKALKNLRTAGTEDVRQLAEAASSSFDKLKKAYGTGEVGGAWAANFKAAKEATVTAAQGINAALAGYASKRIKSLEEEARLHVKIATQEARDVKAAYTALQIVPKPAPKGESTAITYQIKNIRPTNYNAEALQLANDAKKEAEALAVVYKARVAAHRQHLELLNLQVAARNTAASRLADIDKAWASREVDNAAISTQRDAMFLSRKAEIARGEKAIDEAKLKDRERFNTTLDLQESDASKRALERGLKDADAAFDILSKQDLRMQASRVKATAETATEQEKRLQVDRTFANAQTKVETDAQEAEEKIRLAAHKRHLELLNTQVTARKEAANKSSDVDQAWSSREAASAAKQIADKEARNNIFTALENSAAERRLADMAKFNTAVDVQEAKRTERAKVAIATGIKDADAAFDILSKQDIKVQASRTEAVSKQVANNEKQLYVDRVFAQEQQNIADKRIKAQMAAADKEQAVLQAYGKTHIDTLRKQIASQTALVTSRTGITEDTPEVRARQLNVDRIFAAAQAKAPLAPKPGTFAGLKDLALNMDMVHSSARGLASGFNLLWLTWGQMAPLFAGAAVSFAVKDIVSKGAEFTQTMEQIRVLAGATSPQVAELAAQVLDIGKGVYGPLEVAKALKTLSLAGLDAKESAKALPEVLNFAIAGELPVEKAAESLVSISTAFRVSAGNYSYISDVISKTAAESKSDVAGMSEAFKTASVIFQQYGVSIEDTAIGLGLLANAGIQGTSAGTALRNMYADLSARTPKVTKALAAIGTDAIDPTTGKMKNQLEVFKQLDAGLSEYTAKSQSKILHDIFSERGAKEAFAIMSAMHQKAKEESKDVATVYDELAKKIADSAGFAALAAAEMSLTPLNRMKEVGNTLQSTLISVFADIEPVVISVSERLKTTFGSESFKQDLRDIAVGIARITEFLINHAKGLASTVLGYYALRGVLTVVGAGLTMMATAASAAAAGLGTTATAVSMLSKGNPILLALTGIVTAATTAWALYTMWTTKAAEADVTKTSNAGELLKKLEEEEDKINNVNLAKMRGISLDDLENKQALEKAKSLDTSEVVKARAAFTEYNRLYAWRGKQDKEYIRLQSELDSAISRQGETILKLEGAISRVSAARKDAAESAKKEQAEFLNSIKTGNKNYESPQDKGSASYLSDLMSRFNAEETTAQQHYSNLSKMLDLQHHAAEISDGTYYVRKIQLAEEASVKELNIYGRAYAALEEQRDKELALAGTSAAAKRKISEKFEAEADKLLEKESRLAEKKELREKEITANIAAQGVKRIKAVEAEVEALNIKESAESRLQDLRKQAEAKGPEAVARLEGEIKTAEKYDSVMSKLTADAAAATAVLDSFATVTEPSDETTLAYEAQLKLVKELTTAIARLGAAKAKAVEEGGNTAAAKAINDKYEKEQKKLAAEYEKLTKDVGDQLFDALTGKGKDAAGKLREYLKSALLQPFKILLQPVLGAVGSTIAGMLLPGGAAAASMGFGSAAGGAIAGASGGALTGILAGAGAALSTFGTAALASAQSMLGMTGTFAQFSALTQSTFAAATGGSTLAGTLGSVAGPAAVVVAALAALGAFRTTKKVSGGLQGTLGGGADGIHTYDLMRKSGYLLGGPQYKAVDTGVYEFSQQVQNSFDVLKRSTLGMAESLGLSTDALQNFTTRLGSDLIHPDTGGYGIELKDLTPEEAQKKVEEALATANNELAQRILGSFKTTTSVIEDTISEMTGYGDEANLVLKKVSRTVEESTYATSEYALHGEKAIDTLTRLATSLATANGAFDMLGYDLVGTGVKAADAASKIITAFGGLEKFSASMQSYYTNFYSEQERRDVANRQIAAELTRVGIQTTAEQVSNATFAQYRAGVEAIKAQYGADSKQFATAVNLSAQFAEANRPAQEASPVTAATVSDSLTPAQEAAKKQQETLANMATEQTTLEVDLLRAQGNTTAAVAKEIENYSEENKVAYLAQLAVNDALKEQIRIQNSINTLNETTKTTQISLLEAQGQTLAAYALQTNKLSDAEKSISDYNRVLQLQIDTVNNVKSSMKSYLTASEYMHQQLGTMALRLQQGGFSQSIDELIQILAGTSKDDLLKFFLTIKDTAPEAAAAVAAISADFSAMRDAQTAEVQALRSKATQNYLDAQSKVTEAQKAVASVLQTTLQGFHSYLDELNNSTTGIKGTDSLAASRKRFEELADKALKGDTSVIPQLQPAAKAFLDLSKGFSSSVTDYRLDLSAVKIVFTKMEELGKTALDKLPAAVVSDTDAINAAYTQLGLAVRAEFEARRVANAVQASLTDTTKDLVTQYREAIAVLPDWSDALVQLDKVLNVDYEALLVDTLKGYIPDMGVGFSTVELFEKTVKETVPSMGEGFDSSQLYLNKLTEKIPSMGEGFDLSTLVTGGFAATLAARVPSMGASFNLAAMAQSSIDAAVARMVANTPAPIAPAPTVTTPAPVTTTSAVSTSPVSTTTVSGSSPSSAYQQLLTSLSDYNKVANPGDINDNWWRHVAADTRELGLGATDLARALQSGVTGSFLTSSTAASVQTIARSLNLPAFAFGGYHAGGVALVGEEGPELVNMGPSRVYNAGDTQRILGGAGNEELIAEMRLLNNRIVELERSMKEGLYPIARNTRETSEKVVKWDGDGMPPVRT